jgi:hypothetical protein
MSASSGSHFILAPLWQESWVEQHPLGQTIRTWAWNSPRQQTLSILTLHVYFSSQDQMNLFDYYITESGQFGLRVNANPQVYYSWSILSQLFPNAYLTYPFLEPNCNLIPISLLFISFIEGRWGMLKTAHVTHLRRSLAIWNVKCYVVVGMGR